MRKGSKHKPETIAKMLLVDRSKRKTTKGRKYTEEQRENMRIAFARRREYRLSLLKKAGVIATDKRRLPKDEKYNRIKQRTKYKNMIRRFIRATGKKKCSKTEHILGYSQKEFCQHIEKQFKPGMSWSARESFHVDHIIPVAEFFKRGINDPKIICALENLQPLYPQENRNKSDKLLTAYRGTDGKTVYINGLQEIPV